MRSNWVSGVDDFSSAVITNGFAFRHISYKNLNPESKIQGVRYQKTEWSPPGMTKRDALLLYFKSDADRRAFHDSLKAQLELTPFLHELSAKISPPDEPVDHEAGRYILTIDSMERRVGDLDTFSRGLSGLFACINTFEPIEPLSTFIDMKQTMGVTTAEILEEYKKQIRTLYARDGFDAALSLARSCKDAGLEGLVDALAHMCFERRDYNNLLRATSVESSVEYVYESANAIFISDKTGLCLSERRERLKIAMRLFNLCKDFRGASNIAIQIFAKLAGEPAELAGEPFDIEIPPEMKSVSGDALAWFADVLYQKNREIAALKAENAKLSMGAEEGKAGASATYNSRRMFAVPAGAASALPPRKKTADEQRLRRHSF